MRMRAVRGILALIGGLLFLGTVALAVVSGILSPTPLGELRRRRVLTLEELAQKADVGRNTIWRLEHGVMGAQPRTIRKLAKALNVEPEELVAMGGRDG